MGGLGRLRKRQEFTAVYRRGRPYRNELIALRVLPNGLEETRCGFSVGRGIGKAVVRNRVKRRLREGVRSLELAAGWDVVISARQPAAGVRYEGLRVAVAALLSRAGILREAG